MSKRYWKYNKKDIERLITKRTGIGKESLACNVEANDLIMCWATSTQKANDPKCRVYEQALQRCELAMGNTAAAKARAEIKNQLIFQLLRYANKQDKSEVLKNLK